MITWDHFVSINIYVGSGHCNRTPDHNSSKGTSDRLHKAVHVPRDQHNDQEAGGKEPGCVQLHEPAVERGVDVRDMRLRRRVHRPVPRLAVQPVRVAGRGHARGDQGLQRLQLRQQPLVLARGLHAAGL